MLQKLLTKIIIFIFQVESAYPQYEEKLSKGTSKVIYGRPQAHFWDQNIFDNFGFGDILIYILFENPIFSSSCTNSAHFPLKTSTIGLKTSEGR